MQNSKLQILRWLVGLLMAVALLQIPVDGQQAGGTSRLMGFGTPPLGQVPGPTVVLPLHLAEVDPGSGSGAPVQSSGPAFSSRRGLLFAAGNSGAGLIYFVPNVFPQILQTVDASTGTILATVSPSMFIGELHYETTTGRLLCLATPTCCSPPFAQLFLAQVAPLTGMVTTIAPLPGFLGPGVLGNTRSALDSSNHRFFFLYSCSNLAPTFCLWVFDTFTGNVISSVPIGACSFCGPQFTDLHYDTVTNQLYSFGGSGIVGSTAFGLMTVDPATATGTLVGSQSPSIIQPAIGSSFAYDEARREFYYIGQTYPIGAPLGFRLFTFDMDTGQILGDPLMPTWWLALAVDGASIPLRGRISPRPSNTLTQGSTLTITFDALARAGEYYLPFVSCTAGSTAVPSSNLVLPLAFDFCTSLYFSPFGSAFFNLTPGTSLVGTLSPAGLAQGTVSLPSSITPTGLNFDLNITYLTINSAAQWTGLHGQTTLHIGT